MRRVAGVSLGAACILAAGCGRRPPPMPYVTVGLYDGRCGYDYNGVATGVGDLARAAKSWTGRTEATLLFRFEPKPVPRACFERARAALNDAGFGHVWVIVAPHPGPSDRPIMP